MTTPVPTPIEIELMIAARLVERIKDAGLVKFVYTTSEYAKVGEQSQLVPSVVAIYNGYRAGGQVGHGAVQTVILEYLVVIVARSSTQTLRATGAKDKASEIFDPVVRALIGWKPGQGVARLQLTEAPGAGYSDAGYTYLPVAFTTQITYTPQP